MGTHDASINALEYIEESQRKQNWKITSGRQKIEKKRLTAGIRGETSVETEQDQKRGSAAHQTKTPNQQLVLKEVSREGRSRGGGDSQTESNW